MKHPKEAHLCDRKLLLEWKVYKYRVSFFMGDENTLKLIIVTDCKILWI